MSAPLAHGDADGDGAVNGADLGIWQVTQGIRWAFG